MTAFFVGLCFVCTACGGIDFEAKLNDKYSLWTGWGEVELVEYNNNITDDDHTLVIKNFIAYFLDGDIAYLCEESEEKTISREYSLKDMISDEVETFELDLDTQRFWALDMSDGSFAELDMTDSSNIKMVEEAEWDTLWGGRSYEDEECGDETYEIMTLLGTEKLYYTEEILDGKVCLGKWSDDYEIQIVYLLDTGTENNADFF